MNDRELLEAAARAAGINVPKNLNSWLTYDDKCGFQWWNMDGTKTEKTFDPLNDDGDALRLVVKLGISMDTALGQTMAIIPIHGKDCVELHSNDPYAATRRAIVRAAAVMGKAS